MAQSLQDKSSKVTSWCSVPSVAGTASANVGESLGSIVWSNAELDATICGVIASAGGGDRAQRICDGWSIHGRPYACLIGNRSAIHGILALDPGQVPKSCHAYAPRGCPSGNLAETPRDERQGLHFLSSSRVNLSCSSVAEHAPRVPRSRRKPSGRAWALCISTG